MQQRKCLEKFKICNVVSTADLRQPVNIRQLNNYSWGRFDTINNYNGKVGYVKDREMKGRVTVFSSGKLISTGAKTLRTSTDQLLTTHMLLCKNEFILPTRLEPKIRNIVAVFDLKKYIDFDDIINKRKVIYEPEQFPALIYKTAHHTTCLIFTSGKVIIVGSQSKAQIVNTIREIISF